MTASIQGFVRRDGSVGLRNHVLLIPTVTCSAVVCDRIAEAVDGCVAIPHQHGCSQIGADAEHTFDALYGMGANPNVGAVLVVSLGCEVVDGIRLSEALARTGKPVEFLRIQDEGGSLRTIEKGGTLARRLRADVARQHREPVDWSGLRIGVKWGDGLHGFPGHPAPAVKALQALLAEGCGVILGEIEKIVHCIAPARFSPSTWNDLMALWRALVPSDSALIDIPEPAATPAASSDAAADWAYPDVFDAPVASASSFTAPIVGPGLHVTNTPCSDVESLTSLATAGANVAIFFSGGPSPVGSPIMPVIKLGRHDADPLWTDHVDLDFTGSPDADLVRRLLDLVGDVAQGRLTASECLGHQEFSIHRFGLSL